MNCLRVVLSLLLCTCLLACTQEQGPVASVQRPNIFLISIDTLRADHLASYGYSRVTSPFLDSLAAKAVRFDFAASSSAWTLPAHASMLTGLYPSSHGLVLADRSVSRLSKDTAYLPEILRKGGYRTLAFTGGGYLSKAYGFDRGFEGYKISHRFAKGRDSDLESSILALNKALQSQTSEKPLFVFLHTYDVHCPYTVSEPYLSQFKSPDAEPIASDLCGNKAYTELGITPAQARFLSDRYDGAIRRVDELLKDLISGWEAQGLLKNSLLIVTSDHGEEFLEHGRVGHQESLHGELLMVPMIIQKSGGPSRVVSTPVSLVDLAPTILDVAGLPVPSEMQGISLRPLLESTTSLGDAKRFVFSELERGKKMRSHLDLQGHLIHEQTEAQNKFYEYPKDRQELNDQAAARSAEVQQRLNQLRDLEASLLHKTPEQSSQQQTDEQLKQLKTLGYL